MWKEYEIPHERGVCATSYANAFMFFERPSGVNFFWNRWSYGTSDLRGAG